MWQELFLGGEHALEHVVVLERELGTLRPQGVVAGAGLVLGAEQVLDHSREVAVHAAAFPFAALGELAVLGPCQQPLAGRGANPDGAGSLVLGQTESDQFREPARGRRINRLLSHAALSSGSRLPLRRLTGRQLGERSQDRGHEFLDRGEQAKLPQPHPISAERSQRIDERLTVHRKDFSLVCAVGIKIDSESKPRSAGQARPARSPAGTRIPKRQRRKPRPKTAPTAHERETRDGTPTTPNLHGYNARGRHQRD